MKTISFYPTSIGTLEIHSTPQHITYLKFANPDIQNQPSSTPSPLCDRAIAQVREYLIGKRIHFDLPIKMEGTDFQKKVWNELLHIPYGQTVSYLQIAQAIGNPKAVRAVGMANNKNPIVIVVPCHRVIGSNGKLIGYAGGIALKEKLIKIEQQVIEREKTLTLKSNY